MEALLPLFNSVMTRAAIAFISGPAAKRILSVEAEFLIESSFQRRKSFRSAEGLGAGNES